MLLWGGFINYYHDSKIEQIFECLKQPKTVEDIQLSESFIKDLILKIITSFGTVKTSTIYDITYIHWDILEKCLGNLEKEGLCAPVSGSFLFSSVQYSISKKGREKSKGINDENPYIGVAPVSYENYYEIMEAQLKGRYPINIPEDVIESTFSDVVGVNEAKKSLIESCIIGKGIFIYGPPGTGKTYLTSKMSNLLPPVIIPKFLEFGGKVIQIYDPDFHKKCPEQPEDPRWVKIHAPFVLTGSELNLNKLETNYNANKGVYETSPIIKANGGILLIDDLGRQRDDHDLILNRLIVPMENKKDVIYVRGIPVIVHCNFIPAFSTNLDISIMDEAHLRRAPLHIFLRNPPIEDVTDVFRINLDYLKEDYDNEVLDRFTNVYCDCDDGGEGLQPTFAHARDVAQICQAVRINQGKKCIDVGVLEDALKRHVLIVLQRMNIDIAQITHKTRSFRIKTSQIEETKHALRNFGAFKISQESDAVLIDIDDNITPVQLAEYLHNMDIELERINMIAESDKEIKRTIFEI